MAPAFVTVAFSIVAENVTAAGEDHRRGLAGQARERVFLTFFLPFLLLFFSSLSVLDPLSDSDAETSAEVPADTAGAARPSPWDIRQFSPNLHFPLA